MNECLVCFLACLFIINIITTVIELVNDSKIKKRYDNMIYNWNSYPIKTIELSNNKNYELAKIKTNKNIYSFYQWRNKYFKIEKIENYNYINIYNNEDGKLCGKDSSGNDLYFPKDIDCPINGLIITDNLLTNFSDYVKINLEDNYYL